MLTSVLWHLHWNIIYCCKTHTVFTFYFEHAGREGGGEGGGHCGCDCIVVGFTRRTHLGLPVDCCFSELAL